MNSYICAFIKLNKMIKLHDLEFEPYLGPERIQDVVKQLAEELSKDYSSKTPIFLGIFKRCLYVFIRFVEILQRRLRS